MADLDEHIARIDRWVTAIYLNGDPSLSGWPNDPDAGELRLVMTLRDLLVRCEQRRGTGVDVAEIEQLITWRFDQVPA